MFGSRKSGPAEALYEGQNSRDGDYQHAFEYRTVSESSRADFDLKLNTRAQAGWEVVGFHVDEGGTNHPTFHAVLRRPRKP